MKEKQDIHKKVNNLYESVPFPRWDHKKRLSKLPNEIMRFKYMNVSHLLKDAKVLDVGCGTGNRSMLMAKYFEIGELYGLDACKKSLEISKEVAKEEKFDRFKPIHGSLFELPFEDNTFDVVMSWGVLHHTFNPQLGLKEMHRVCKKGGYVCFFVYNSIADWRHNLRRADIKKNGGDSQQSKFDYALNKYSDKRYRSIRKEFDMTPEERAHFYDEYVHPHKSDHTINEIIEWQKDLNIEYSGTYPPLRFRDTISWIKDRYSLNSQFPVSKSLYVKLLILLTKFIPYRNPTFKKPTKFHIFLWHIFYFIQGADGSYSHGPAIAGRKK